MPTLSPLPFRDRIKTVAFHLKAAAWQMVFGRYGGTPGVNVSVYGGGGYGGAYGTAGGYYGLGLPNAENFDYAGAIGDLTANAVVSIGLGWITDNFPKPKLQVTRLKAGQPEPVLRHPLLNLIRDPNPDYDAFALWTATVISYVVDGNAFWLKARARRGRGRPVELWYVPHWLIQPAWKDDGSEFISGYRYFIDGRWTDVPKEDVVHFSDGMDFFTRRGRSRLAAVLRDVLTDNEGAAYSAFILRNMGIPGVLLGPKAGQPAIPPEAREAIEERYIEKTTGAKRGRPLIFADPMEVLTSAAFSPEQMALDKLRTIPALRILAALRLHPALVHLASVGPSSFDNGGQHDQARKAGYEDCLMPMQDRFAAKLAHSLLPDLGDADREEVGWDYSKTPVGQEDEDAKAKRVVSVFLGDIFTLNEARTKLGEEGLPEGDPRGAMFHSELYPKMGAPVTGAGEGQAPESGGDQGPLANLNGRGNGRQPQPTGLAQR